MATTAKPADKGDATAPTTEDLAAQIATLRADIADLGVILRQYGEAQAGQARERVRHAAQDLRSEAERRAEAAEDAFHHAADSAADAVRKQPGMALGMAAALGFMVGLLTGRR